MTKKLEEYEKKRDFDKTAEPKAKTKSSGKALRFVVQRHDASRLHYDFRLEHDGVLLSWAVPKGPSLNPKDKRLAVRVEDHPIDYRDFEGTIPQDEYGGGTVQLFDEGNWIPTADPALALKEGALKFTLQGERLRGAWALIRMKPKADGEDNWLLIKEKDGEAKADEEVTSIPTSVRTGRTLAEIAAQDASNQEDKASSDEAPETIGRAGDTAEDDFIVGGYTVKPASRHGLSALLLGKIEEGRLVYLGRAGTGFSKNDAQELLQRFKSRQRKTSPFSEEPRERKEESVTWIRPDISVRIRFEPASNGAPLRHAAYVDLADTSRREPEKGARSHGDPDKKQAKASTEPAYGAQRLTSPDKLVFPLDGITKQDIADYYWGVRELILPYLTGRPLTFIRCMEQIGDECFFQKHENQPIPGVEAQTLQGSSNEEGKVMAIRGEDGLMGAVQMGAVEFHSWGSTTAEPDRPDWLVFDLDPDEGMAIDKIRRGVRDLKSLLDEIGLAAYLKTSGGKGYHIVIPLSASSDWAIARAFARDLAERMEKTWPRRYTANPRKKERKGRIYVDYVRNGRGATSVSTFSLRARPGAPLSWPLRWEDLDETAPDEITLKNHDLFRHTLQGWADFLSIEQTLRPKG